MGHLFRCPYCGTRVSEPNSICSKCKQYLKNKEGTIYKPNDKLGVQDFDYKGRPICKICGKAFDNLGNHIYPSHKITVKEYKIKFDLPISLSLSSKKRFNELSKRPVTRTAFKKGCNHKGVGKGIKKRLTEEQRKAQAERLKKIRASLKK